MLVRISLLEAFSLFVRDFPVFPPGLPMSQVFLGTSHAVKPGRKLQCHIMESEKLGFCSQSR